MTNNVATQPGFRAAHTDDIDAVVALVESGYRGEASRQGWTTEAEFLDGQRTDAAAVDELVTRPHSRIVLAESADGLLLACAHLEKKDETAWFGLFSVRPQLQGGRIGRAMLAEAERIARGEWHCCEMHMTVISIRDELIAWYERRGYRRSGVFSPFPYGNARFGIPRRGDLQFEILHKPLEYPEPRDAQA